MRIVHAVIALVAAAGLALAPQAVEAAAVSHADPAGDVVRNASPSDVAAPNAANGDITSLRATHLATTVRVRVRFRELSRAGDFQHLVRVYANTGTRLIYIAAGAGAWQGTASMTNWGGTPIRCAMNLAISYPQNYLWLSIPRTCMRNPRWVQVGAITDHFSGGNDYLDDAYRVGAAGQFPALGPRVYP